MAPQSTMVDYGLTKLFQTTGLQIMENKTGWSAQVAPCLMMKLGTKSGCQPKFLFGQDFSNYLAGSQLDTFCQ